MINSETYIIKLNEIERKDFNKVGGKAANLGQLIHNNFAVPEGFVVSSAVYLNFLKKNNLKKEIQNYLSEINYSNHESIKNCSKKIQKAIERSSMPSELINEIKSAYNQLNSDFVAVRSSASAEDLLEASFAGQYDTFLNLKNYDQVLLHIKRCYASIWTNRAISYRQKNKIPHDEVEMATIVQKMVPAKSAGVLFTINPITSKKSEILIESNFGLAESIVSGRSSPDQFMVQKTGKSRKQSFKILNKRIGNKMIAAHPKQMENESGIEYVELTDEMNKQPSLSDKEVIQLAKVGAQIEKFFGGRPQDIEWAIDQNNNIFILQSRPITSLKSASDAKEISWSRGYSDDYWNDPVTPLFFNLLGNPLTTVVNMELNSIMGYESIDKKFLKLSKAHVYFNLNVLKRKVEYEIPGFMRMDDLLNYFPSGSGPYGKITMKNLPFHIFKRIIAEIRIMFHDPNGSMSKTAKAYEEWTKETFNPYCKEFDSRLEKLAGKENINSLVDLAEELDRIMVAHYRLVRYGIPVHNIGMNLMIQYLLSKLLSKGESLRFYPILISGLKHKLTETNDRIHELASIIHESSELKSIITEKESKKIHEYLLSDTNPSVKNFLTEFDKFLQEHGDRGFTREMYYPRWKESPMTSVFDILKSLNTDQWQELDKLKAKNLKKREIIGKLVESKIRLQQFGILKWKIFSIILKNSRKYIIFRENQRFNLDKWITRSRNVYLEIGKIFTKQGILSDENKIFFIWKNEIKKLALGKYNNQEITKLSSEVIDRFEHFLKYENVIPPKFLLGNREFDDTLQYTYDSHIFRGIPASQGIITASVRVLHNIDEISNVRAGEIIIVPRTDPGWTPIFSKIGGLITETGGILSHGAVVSREYGIPAVTNIINACKLFNTGQVLTINGYEGIVSLQK